MKNNIQHKFRFFSILLAFVLTCSIFSQVKDLPHTPIFYSANQDANNPIPVSALLSKQERSEQEKQLERQLEAARLSNNSTKAEQIQEQLDIMRGAVQVYHQDLPGNYFYMNNEYEFDHIQTQIHGINMKSHAFGVAPSNSTIAGRLFYLYVRDGQPNLDSLIITQSTNNGATWIQYFRIFMSGYAFNKNELDLEVVYDGTNTYLFATAGVTSTTDNSRRVLFLRANITASGISATVLNFPGSGQGMNYYNPRITSDNSNYTSTARVMLVCSMDSLAGSTHYVKQKFVLLSTPFASPLAFNYTQPNGTNGFGWAGNNGTNGNTYLYSDIAYYKDDGGTGENRVMTVYGNPGSGIYNIYLAYVSNYSTLGATLFISEPNANKDVKIAFNGGANNRYGMITYVKQVSGTNWDIYGLKTSSGGSTSGAWTGNALDNTSERARTCDLIAVRNTAGQFKICYTQDSANQPAAFYRSYNGSSWSERYIYSTLKSDTVFATPKAGYILTGGDDGIAFWSQYGGFSGYSARLMITTTGIVKNNEIPSGYSLSQNYPNPFNPVTNIKFSIPKAGIVKLIVYDITGKEVASLINQNLNAGSYNYDLDASNFASGAYFYRLTTDGFTDIKKMILVK